MRMTEGRRAEVRRRGGSSPPEEIDHLVTHDSDDGLGGGQALEDFLARCLLTDAVEELLGHLEVDVRLEQARRISRRAASTSETLREPCPRRVRNTPSSLSLRASNTAAKSSRQRRGRSPPRTFATV
jgi:hypothetical protein